MDLEREPVLYRAVRICKAVGEYFVFHKINRHRGKSLGARLRESCERLGLVFIKMGQVLSTRYDILDRKDCEELQKLLDSVPPIPYPEVEGIFMADFGKPPEEVFQEFSREPLASASISQVHVAVLPDGSKAAVKVRRPGIERTIAADLKVLRMVARLGQVFSPTLRRIDLPEVIRQMEEWLWLETDFAHERGNLLAAREFYARKSSQAGGYAAALVFPKPYLEFCSRQVITMEFLEGVPAKDFQKILGDPEYDPRRSLEDLVRSVLCVWMTGDEFMFHGDPHPSNILLMKGGKVGLLDLGLLSAFSAKDVQETRDLFLAVYSRNVDLSIRYMLQMSGAPYEKYADRMREDVQKYLEATRTSGMGFWFVGVIRICIAHGVPMPYQLVLFGRTQILLDGLFETVLPGSSTLDVLGEELEKALRQRVFRNLKEINLTAVAYVLTEKFKKSPEALAAFLDRYMEHPLDLVAEVSRAVQGVAAERV